MDGEGWGKERYVRGGASFENGRERLFQSISVLHAKRIGAKALVLCELRGIEYLMMRRSEKK